MEGPAGLPRQEDFPADRLVVPLLDLAPLTDKAFSLAKVAESKVNDRPAVRFKVSQTGCRDVMRCLGKEARLLVGRGTKAEDIYLGEVEFHEELIYGEYKEFDGVNRPTKVRNGKDAMESTRSDDKLAEEFEEKLFAKPQ